MDWTPAAIANLRRLWAEGHSTAEIARRMDTTKNAIIGKSHRLGLPGRPSPIKRKAAAVETRQQQAVAMGRAGHATGEISAKLGIHVDTARTLLRRAGLNRPPGRAQKPKPAPRPKPEPAALELAPAVPPAPHPLMRGGATGCRWPHGEPRTAAFRYCDAADVVEGKPYCAEHCLRAYVQPGVPIMAYAPRRLAA